MAWRDGATEERNRVRVLDEHCAEPVRRRVAFHDKVLGEVRHRQDGGRGDRSLKRVEGRGGCVGLGEAFLEQGGQRRSDGAEIVDEFAIVPGQAKEPADCPCRTWHWPVMDGLHLGRIHGDAHLRDDVTEV